MGESRNDLSQQLQTLGGQLRAKKVRPCHIPAWACEGGDQLVRDRIGHGHRDDGDCASRLLGRARGCRTQGDNDIALAPDQFRGQLAEPIRSTIGILSLYGEVLSLRVTKVVQSLQEGVEHVEGWVRKLGAPRRQDAYPRHRRCLLRTCLPCPCDRRAADKRDEIASPHGKPPVLMPSNKLRISRVAGVVRHNKIARPTTGLGPISTDRSCPYNVGCSSNAEVSLRRGKCRNGPQAAVSGCSKWQRRGRDAHC